jgi:5'-3' exonuclease
VPGIGDKTAAVLIRAFGDLETLKSALDKGHGGFPPGTRKKLEAAREYLDIAPAVVATAIDVPLGDDIDGTLPAVPPDQDLLTEIGDELGLGSSLTRFRAIATRTGATRTSATRTSATKTSDATRNEGDT